MVSYFIIPSHFGTIHLVESKQYRKFAKEVFKEMFKYAKTQVPSDSILEELVTNCNQAGYVGSLMGDDKSLTEVGYKCGLSFESIDYEIHINYDSKKNHATIKVEEPISTRVIAKPEEKLCKLDSSYQFPIQQKQKNYLTNSFKPIIIRLKLLFIFSLCRLNEKKT